MRIDVMLWDDDVVGRCSECYITQGVRKGGVRCGEDDHITHANGHVLDEYLHRRS